MTWMLMTPRRKEQLFYLLEFAGRINSSLPSAAYLRRWAGSALVQIMACRLDGAKPLSELMLTYYQLDPMEHISMKFYVKL